MSETKKILVVDDDEDIIKVIKLRLQNAGYEVLVAGDGEQGMIQAQRNMPHLIIADLMMPHMNGWKFSMTLRQDERFKRIPIIFLSAIVDKEGPAEKLE